MFYSKIRKFDLFLSLIAALGLIFIGMSNYQGIGFPKKNELKYTTGVFNIDEQPEFINYIILTRTENSSDNPLFACSYSPFGNGASSSCGDKKFLTRYVDNIVTIGWYEQEYFLGFKNNVYQLVTIEMNNEIKRSYDETASLVRESGEFYSYVFIPISILSFPFFYWLFGWLTAVGNRVKKVDLEK